MSLKLNSSPCALKVERTPPHLNSLFFFDKKKWTFFCLVRCGRPREENKHLLRPRFALVCAAGNISSGLPEVSSRRGVWTQWGYNVLQHTLLRFNWLHICFLPAAASRPEPPSRQEKKKKTCEMIAGMIALVEYWSNSALLWNCRKVDTILTIFQEFSRYKLLWETVSLQTMCHKKRTLCPKNTNDTSGGFHNVVDPTVVYFLSDIYQINPIFWAL